MNARAVASLLNCVCLLMIVATALLWFYGHSAKGYALIYAILVATITAVTHLWVYSENPDS